MYNSCRALKAFLISCCMDDMELNSVIQAYNIKMSKRILKTKMQTSNDSNIAK